MVEKCEMCGKKNRTVHIGQCSTCHAEICDEPASECIAKQMENRKSWFPFYD